MFAVLLLHVLLIMLAHLRLKKLWLFVVPQWRVFLHMTQFRLCLRLLLQRCIGYDTFSNATVLLGWTHRTTFFLERIWNIDRLTTKVLAFHLLDGVVGRFKIVKADEPILLRFIWLCISHNLRGNDDTKLTENIFKLLFVNTSRQVSNEDISPNLLSPFILRCLVDFNCFIEKFDHM